MSKIDEIQSAFDRELDAANTTRDLLDLHSRYFGSKGIVKDIFRELKSLPAE